MLCAAATTAMDDVYIAQSQEHAINSRLFSVYTCYKIHFAILLELAVGSGQTDRLSLLLVYNYPIHTRRLCGHAKSHEIHGIAFARVFSIFFSFSFVYFSDSSMQLFVVGVVVLLQVTATAASYILSANFRTAQFI